MEPQYRTLDRRSQPDGRELWLVENAKGEKRLWIPRVIGKDKIRLEILRRLKEAILPEPPVVEGYFPLLNAFPYEEYVVLEIRFEDSLWDGWEAGIIRPVSPDETVRWLRCVWETISAFESLGLTMHSVHPTDLLPLSQGNVGLLDPRISAAIAESFSLDPPQEYYYPPEILRGKPWTSASTWYSVGLCAYSLASGVFPYGDEEKAEVTRRILEEKPLDIRFHVPSASKILASLLEGLLAKAPEKRPSPTTIESLLHELTTKGARAEESAEQNFIDKASRTVEQREKVRRFKRFWRVGRWGVAVLILVVLGIYWTRPGYKPVLTPEMSPGQVVSYYYKALAELDAMLIDETLAKGVGKEIRNMVDWAFVISLYDPTGTPRRVMVLSDLQVTPEPEESLEARFSAGYTLEIYSARVKKTQRRSDEITLRRVGKIWRIVELDSRIVEETEEPWEE